MIIRSVEIRHFRSVKTACLSPCGVLNILIGRNSAGKSNILSAISLVFSHLREGNIAGRWAAARLQSEFHNRVSSTPIRIGVELTLTPEVNDGLRSQLTKDVPHLDKSIEQIKEHDSAVFVLSGVREGPSGFLYIEQLGVGRLKARGEDLSIDGIRLLTVGQAVAAELYRNVMSSQSMKRDLTAIEELKTGSGSGPSLEYMMDQPKDSRPSVALWRRGERSGAEIIRQIDSAISTANSLEEAQSALAAITSSIKAKIDALEKREIAGVITAFAGDTKTPPTYATWLMKQFGSIPILQIGEAKRPIGREEAETLLRLKVKRGGPERLQTLQNTVRNLLGVEVDAFESDSRGEGTAEMDVDDFLVEANGAGIREALRVILDLELRSPKLVLIEEPEVHLHPGLARVVAEYLREKSRDIQIFITTHSTEFVDIGSFQNIFLVSRNDQKATTCKGLTSDDAVSKLPTELGLKLSTVFMFDRLVFVEGPSDEAILRQFAEKLDSDLAKNNVGFVRMGGVRNFAHYAAESTLDVLARRRVIMTFIADRDERDDTEVGQMMAKLGDRAHLRVLARRELENYLLIPSTVHAFITEKLKLAGSETPPPAIEEIRAAIEEEALALRDEVIRLRLERRILKPVFLHTRNQDGTIEDKLRTAAEELAARLSSVESDRRVIAEAVDASWAAEARDQAPGCQILERVAARFGVKFAKDRGDSERLARFLSKDAISYDIKELFETMLRSDIDEV